MAMRGTLVISLTKKEGFCYYIKEEPGVSVEDSKFDTFKIVWMNDVVDPEEPEIPVELRQLDADLEAARTVPATPPEKPCRMCSLGMGVCPRHWRKK